MEKEIKKEKNVLFQVSLLQALTLGHYEGILSAGALKEHGDFGIGTFHGLDGEMILLDGILYRADGEGHITVPGDAVTVPFADVTFFEAEEERVVPDCRSAKELARVLTEAAEEKGRNGFRVFRTDARFRRITVRSERGQEKPWRRLDEVMKTEQRVFTYENIFGTLIGLCCPPWTDRLNMPGWHFHFLSESRTAGGHVLDLSFAGGTASLAGLSRFELLLPDTEEFGKLDLQQDLRDAVSSAEG